MASNNYGGGLPTGSSIAGGAGGANYSGVGIGSLFKDLQKVYTSGVKPMTIDRPNVPLPNRGDYGTPYTPTPIKGPKRGDYGNADRGAVDRLAGELTKFRGEYDNPTATAAFQNLMKLANEQTAAQESEVSRGARDAASRAGYTGGFDAAAKQAARDRMSAISQTGFAGAAQVRGEALQGYASTAGAYASAMGSYNQAMAEMNTAYGHDVANAAIANANLGLNAAQLNQQQQQAWAGAKSEAQRLQAQIDSAYNSQLIDINRYNQMSASVAAQLAMQQYKMMEEARQFDLSRQDALAKEKWQEGFAEKQLGLSQLEAARQRQTMGIDPRTGQRYGQTHIQNRPATNYFEDLMRRYGQG